MILIEQNNSKHTLVFLLFFKNQTGNKVASWLNLLSEGPLSFAHQSMSSAQVQVLLVPVHSQTQGSGD